MYNWDTYDFDMIYTTYIGFEHVVRKRERDIEGERERETERERDREREIKKDKEQ